MPNDKTNEYYQRQNESDPFTLARGDAIEAELDAIQVGFDHLPSPRTDGTKGYITSFTVVEPTKDEHPAQKQQVDAVESKNTNQDGRLDNIENVLAGGFVTANRYTTLRYLATQDQTEIILPTSFGELAFLHVNGLRKFPNGIGFTYDVSSKKVTLTEALSLNDEVLIDVGIIPDALLADLIAIQNDIAEKYASVSNWNDQVDTWQQEVSTNRETVATDKQVTVEAKEETKATHALLQKLHLGSHAVAPTKDNDNNPLTEGASYYNSTDGKAYVYESSAWVITNLSAITTVAKTSPTGKAHLPVGTSAQGGTPDKGAVRFDDDEQMLKVGDGLEWRPLGGGGVPDFIVKSADFEIARRKAFAFDMGDDVNKTATIPNGLDNNSWFAVTTLNWTGNDGIYCYVQTLDEEWNAVEGLIDSTTRRIRISQNATVFFQKINGKWSVVDGIGIGGGGASSSTAAVPDEPFIILDDESISEMFMVAGGRYLWDMKKANSALSKMPVGAPDGAKVTIGDANDSASILKPIGITAGIPIHGRVQTLYITNPNTVLTFEKINDTIGWKIIDGIGEGQSGNLPYKEYILLPVGAHLNGNFELPDDLDWTDFERVEMTLTNASQLSLTLGTGFITKEDIAVNPTSFSLRASFDDGSVYRGILTASSKDKASYLAQGNGNARIKQIKAYTKYKPTMTQYPTPWIESGGMVLHGVPNSVISQWTSEDTFRVRGLITGLTQTSSSPMLQLPSAANALAGNQYVPLAGNNIHSTYEYFQISAGASIANMVYGAGTTTAVMFDVSFILKPL